MSAIAVGAAVAFCEALLIMGSQSQLLMLTIGCGLCVTGCTTDAVQLQKKPDAELVHPTEDFAAWEKERLRNRGLSKQGQSDVS